MLDARAVVEVGTGTGVSGLWLLRGMRADGVLTTVDIEAEHQRLARETFTEAGIARPARPHDRRRRARRAAPAHRRPLRPGLLRRRQGEYAAYLKEALRLLRPGGVVAFDNALWHDRVADPSQRDEETVAIRDLGREIAEHDDAGAVLLPVGDGLLAAKKEWAPRGGVRTSGSAARAAEAGAALGDRHDLARLDQDRRGCR